MISAYAHKANARRFLGIALGPAMLASLLCGCAVEPPHPISAVKVTSDYQARSLDDPGLKALLGAQRVSINPSQDSWALDSLTLAALYYSPEIDQARAQWRQAIAAEKTAAAHPNPALSGSAGYNSTTAAISPWILDFAIDLFLDLTGRHKEAEAAASAQTEAARFHLASVAWQVRSHIRAALLETYAARSSLQQLSALADAQRSGVEMADAMLNLGGISPYEVSQSRNALVATQALQTAARVRESDAIASLARAVGVAPDALRATTLDLSSFDHLPDTIPERTARHSALLDRADLLEAIANYDAADAAVREAQANRLGEVKVSPGYEFDQGDNKWSLGLGITPPIFDDHRGPIGEAVAQRDAARAKVEAVQADAISALDGAINAYQETRRAVIADDATQARLKHDLDVARARVALGEASRFELLQRAQEIANAALSRENAQIAAQAALGRLEDAMQQSALALPMTPTPARRPSDS